VDTDQHDGHSPGPLEIQPAVGPASPLWVSPRRPPRFQHRYARHVVLFLLTFATTSMAGACHQLSFEASMGSIALPVEWQWSYVLGGMSYSVPLLLILGAHEFGHYVYCRIHQVDATLPYFLPFPVPLTGTLGAVIRIREAFPSKRALFDIGVAGPIAGFVVLLPFLWWGMTLSGVVRFPDSTELIYFGEPLLLKAIAGLHFGPLPEGFDIVLHPMGFAAWFGMLATALNLLPFGQLDGGHIAYSIFGARTTWVSAATLAIAILLFATQSSSWFGVALMMLVMALVLGLRHPRIIDEDTRLDAGRVAVAILSLVIFVICFTPVPIEMFLSNP